MSCICAPHKNRSGKKKRGQQRNARGGGADESVSPMENLELEYDPSADPTGMPELPMSGSVPVLAMKNLPLPGDGKSLELSAETLAGMFLSDRDLLARVAVADWHARLLAKELAVLGTACDESPAHLDTLGEYIQRSRVGGDSKNGDDDEEGDSEDEEESGALGAAEISVHADKVIVEQATLSARPLLDRLKAATNAAAGALSSLIDTATALVTSGTNGALAARGAPLVASCQQGQPTVLRLAGACVALSRHYDAAERQASNAFELLAEGREASAMTMGIRAAKTALLGAQMECSASMASVTDMLSSLQDLLTVRADIRRRLWEFVDTPDKAPLDENCMALAGDATAQPELATLARTMARTELATADRACLDVAQQLRALIALHVSTDGEAQPTPASSVASATATAAAVPATTALTAAASLQEVIRDTHEALAAMPSPLAASAQHSAAMVSLVEQVHQALHRTGNLPAIPAELAEGGALSSSTRSVVEHTDAAVAALAGAQSKLAAVFGDFDEDPCEFLGGDAPALVAAGSTLAGLNITLSLLLVRLAGTLDYLRNASRTAGTLPPGLRSLHDGVAAHLYAAMQSFLDGPRTPHLSRAGSQHDVAAAGAPVPPPGSIVARPVRGSDAEPDESVTSGPYGELATATSTLSSGTPEHLTTAVAAGQGVFAETGLDGTVGNPASSTATSSNSAKGAAGASGLTVGSSEGSGGGRSPNTVRRGFTTVAPGLVDESVAGPDELRRVELLRGKNGLGFSFGTSALRPEVLVMTVKPGSIADVSGRVFPDDQIVTVNGKSTVGLTHDEIMDLLLVPTVVLELAAPHPECMYALIQSEFNDRDFELHRVTLPPALRHLGATLVSVVGHPGHVVNSVDETGAAAEAGVKLHDVIVALNCENVLTTPHETLVPYLVAGDCQLTVARRRSTPRPTTAGAGTSTAGTAGTAASGARSVTAVPTATTTTSASEPTTMRQRFEVVLTRVQGKLGMTIASSRSDPSTAVQEVVPGGAADRVGIQPGDIIVSVDGQDTTNMAHAVVTASLSKKQPMAVVLERIISLSVVTPESGPARVSAALGAGAGADAGVGVGSSVEVGATAEPTNAPATSAIVADQPSPAGLDRSVALPSAAAGASASSSAATAPESSVSNAAVAASAAAAAAAVTNTATTTGTEAPAVVSPTAVSMDTWSGLEAARAGPPSAPVALMSAAVRAGEVEDNKGVDPQISLVSLASQGERKTLPNGYLFKVVLMRSLTGSLGLRIRTEEDMEGSVVASVLDDGPADKTRLIQRGDYLLGVNGESVIHHEHSAIIRLLRVAENPVTLEFLRPAEPTNAVARTDSLYDAAPAAAVAAGPDTKGYTSYDAAAAAAGLRTMPPWPGAAMPAAPPPGGAHQYHTFTTIGTTVKPSSSVSNSSAAAAAAAVATVNASSAAALASVSGSGASSAGPNGVSAGPTQGKAVTNGDHSVAAGSSAATSASNNNGAVNGVSASSDSAAGVRAGAGAAAAVAAAGSAVVLARPSEPEQLSAGYLEDSEEEDLPQVIAPPRLLLPREEMEFNAKDARRVRIKRDSKTGFGMRLRTLEQRPGTRVLEVLPNSPAAKSKKIQQGDVIYAINGEVVVHMDHDTVSAKIRDATRLDMQLISQAPELLLPHFEAAAEDPTPQEPVRQRRQRIPFPPSLRVPAPEPDAGKSTASTRVTVVGNLRYITLTPRQKARLGLTAPPTGYCFPVIRSACKGCTVGESLVAINGQSTQGRELNSLNALLRELGTIPGEVGVELGPGYYVTLCRGNRSFGLKLNCGEEQGVTVGLVKPDGSAAQCAILREGAWVTMVNGSMVHRSVSDVTAAIIGQNTLAMLVVDEVSAKLMRPVASKCDNVSPVPLAAVAAAAVATANTTLGPEAGLLERQFHPSRSMASVAGLAGSMAGSSPHLGITGPGSGVLSISSSIAEERGDAATVGQTSGSGAGAGGSGTGASGLAATTSVGSLTVGAVGGNGTGSSEAAGAGGQQTTSVRELVLSADDPAADTAQVVAALTAVTTAARESAAREAVLRVNLVQRDAALEAARRREAELQATAALAAAERDKAQAALLEQRAALLEEQAARALADEATAAQLAAAFAALEQQQARAAAAAATAAATSTAATAQATKNAAASADAAMVAAAAASAAAASDAAASDAARTEAADQAAADQAAVSARLAAADKQIQDLTASLQQAHGDLKSAQAAATAANADAAAAHAIALAAEEAAAAVSAQAAETAAAAAAAAAAATAQSDAAGALPLKATNGGISDVSESGADGSDADEHLPRARRVSPLRKAVSLPMDVEAGLAGAGSSGADADDYMDTDGAGLAGAREQELAAELAVARAEIEQLRLQLLEQGQGKSIPALVPGDVPRDRRPTLSPVPAVSPTVTSPKPVRSQRLSLTVPRAVVPEPTLDVDKEVNRIASHLKIPASKVACVAKEKYRFFDDPKLHNVRIYGKNVMVRVGGGWQRLEEFLQIHAGFATLATMN